MSEINTRCPFCDGELSELEDLRDDDLGAGMCMRDDCHGGAVFHIPKGANAVAFMINLRHAEYMIEGLGQAAASIFVEDVLRSDAKDRGEEGEPKGDGGLLC